MNAGAPILPPATIGILGGGQLGRMLGLAARELGYRVAVLDPDPDCPAAAIADRVEIGAYDDTAAALRLAADVDVLTYELEHVSAAMVATVAEIRPVRPGIRSLQVTQDRLAERAFLGEAGAAVVPWRAVHTVDDLRVAASELGFPLRLKASTGGYDGRSQFRIADNTAMVGAIARLNAHHGQSLLAEHEVEFTAELSVVVARGADGSLATYPVGRNRHDEGILVESVAPAPIDPDVAAAATALARRLADAVDLVGVMTVELFLMPGGGLVVNELAPRVHNSGHWTIEAAITSQFEQHVRAMCGLPLGSTVLRAAAATVNLLGTGARRPARLAGLEDALALEDVHLHVYDKREVFERRKMGHVTATAATIELALGRAMAAHAMLRWSEEG
ncbi:MAG: 5-(carboxyamino)imidazole ribonucleotide synthase [Chloroflexota bacterium]